MTVLCPYCGNGAALVGGGAIYPHRPDLAHKLFWLCAPCRAYVGCHDGTSSPLGRLANAELRKAKVRAHAAFDPLWKGGHMRRSQAYVWLAGKLNIDPNKCHIGMFDVATCEKVIAICKEGLYVPPNEQQAKRRKHDANQPCRPVRAD